MFKDDYCKEIDSISASEKFKADTISLMYAKQEEINTAKTIKFKPKRYTKIAAAILVMVLSITAYSLADSDWFITADSTENQEYEYLLEYKDSETDSLPYSAEKNAAMMRTYSINDAVEISATGDTDQQKTKVYFNGQNNGGMGFEGYQFYSPSQLEQNSAYTVGDEIETLPVYQCITLTHRETDSYIKEYLSLLGFEYTELKYNWCKPVYREGHHYTDETINTTSADVPEEEYRLFSVTGKLFKDDGTTGELWRWPANNTVGIMTDKAFTDSNNMYDVIDVAFNLYPQILNKENMEIHSWYHFNIYGELTYDLYAYEKSSDYGENLFNSTLNNIKFSQYKHYEEDTQPTRSSFHFTLPAYEKVTDLPVIDYRQALGALYSGQFYSSYSDEINPDATVAHIEMVYLSPDYDMATKTKSGYALPFYKFYVQLDEDYNRQTENGTLSTYAAYYVCAVHPDYIQLDDSYFHYN